MMTAIIGYGSLINQDQLARESLSLHDIWPVRVDGYQRIFNQEPTWRMGRGRRRAVLNVVAAPEHYFNGVLVRVQGQNPFHRLDERERGYNRLSLEATQVRGFADGAILEEEVSTYIYSGKPEKRGNDLLPNDDYLELCLNGAKQWGHLFYETFLNTTYVGVKSLKQFLENGPE